MNELLLPLLRALLLQPLGLFARLSMLRPPQLFATNLTFCMAPGCNKGHTHQAAASLWQPGQAGAHSRFGQSTSHLSSTVLRLPASPPVPLLLWQRLPVQPGPLAGRGRLNLCIEAQIIDLEAADLAAQIGVLAPRLPALRQEQLRGMQHNTRVVSMPPAPARLLNQQRHVPLGELRCYCPRHPSNPG